MANAGIAQKLTTAKIENISKNGLHAIVLPTEIRSVSNKDLSDFRIFDAQNNEVPYYYNIDNQGKTSQNYVDYKVISRTVVPKKSTTIIFENSEKKINELTFTIANYEGEKSYNLLGGNDQQNWFGLTSDNVLYDLNASEDLNIVKTITFPLTDYKFLKIELNDKNSLPISILKIGNSHSETKFSELLPVKTSKVDIKDLKSEKITKIHISFDDFQYLNQIKFNITEPKLYKRSVRIYKIVNQKVKHKFENIEQEITNFELISVATNSFSLNTIFEKDFYIEIQNQDNPPLKIADIDFYQTPISVIADLKANEKYTIKTGNPTTMAPNYDLESFINLIPSTLPKATITGVEIPKSEVKATKEKPFYEQSWFMWACICIGGVAILYFSANLLKDLNEPNS